jgi:hypothetical protein
MSNTDVMKKTYRSFLLFGLIPIILSSCELSFETVVVYDDRNDFIGSYEVEEYSESMTSTFIYDITIRKSRYSDGVIWINNFYDANIQVFAEVKGNKFYIPLQRIGNWEIEGRGSLFGGDELSMTYTVREIMPGPDYVDFLNSIAWKFY